MLLNPHCAFQVIRYTTQPAASPETMSSHSMQIFEFTFIFGVRRVFFIQNRSQFLFGPCKNSSLLIMRCVNINDIKCFKLFICKLHYYCCSLFNFHHGNFLSGDKNTPKDQTSTISRFTMQGLHALQIQCGSSRLRFRRLKLLEGAPEKRSLFSCTSEGAGEL